MSNIINKTKELIAYYLKSNYEIKEINILQQEIETILGESLELKSGPVVGYDTLQEALGSLNEKEYFRKSKPRLCYYLFFSKKLHPQKQLRNL